MVPVLLALYILHLGLAVAGSLWSSRLKRRVGLPFMRTFHAFVLVSFAYAVVNFIGEVLAPAVFAAPAESMIEVWLIVDLITIPMLGGLFVLLFAWIIGLLGRTVPPALKTAFWAAEAVFLAVFLTAFVSYFVRGVSIVSHVEIIVLDGIIALLLVAAVAAMIAVPPAGDEPARRRLARGLGLAYLISLSMLGATLAAPFLFQARFPWTVVLAGVLFLFNLPALAYLQKAHGTLPPPRILAPSEAQGLDALARDTGITEREREIILLVASGLDTRQIGERLFISPKTVKNHMTSVYAKTGARNRVQLVNLLKRPR